MGNQGLCTEALLVPKVDEHLEGEESGDMLIPTGNVLCMREGTS
jgi:hypothetical protein